MAVSRTQLLTIEPATELEFCGPFTTVQTSTIKLTNPTSNRITFKVKTTVPKRYCVRPSCGIVEPLESEDVLVMLQPFDCETNERNKHKFMILSMIFDNDSSTNLEQFWKDAPSDSISDTRLKCILRLPDELLKIEPSTLVFEGLPSEPSICTITAKNASPQDVCFKVKTNAPRRYNVNPNEGIIKARDSQSIKVCTVPGVDSAGESKDMLVVLSTVAPDVVPSSLDQFWPLVDKSRISEKKIICTTSDRGQVINSHDIEHLRKINHEMSGNYPGDNKLTSEIEQLRKENAKLKAEQARTRLFGLNSGSLAESRPAETGGFLLMNSVPPMVFLLITFLVALFVGKYVL